MVSDSDVWLYIQFQELYHQYADQIQQNSLQKYLKHLADTFFQSDFFEQATISVLL